MTIEHASLTISLRIPSIEQKRSLRIRPAQCPSPDDKSQAGTGWPRVTEVSVQTPFTVRLTFSQFQDGVFSHPVSLWRYRIALAVEVCARVGSTALCN